MTSEYYFSTFNKQGFEVFLVADGVVHFGRPARGYDPPEDDEVTDIRVFVTDKKGMKIAELNDSEINELEIDLEYVSDKLCENAYDSFDDYDYEPEHDFERE